MKLGISGILGVAAIAITVNPAIALTSDALTSPNDDAPLQVGDRATPVQVAAIPDYCRPGESVFVTAETADYWVSICGGDLPHTYVGVNKRNGHSIRVPLDNYEQDGSAFEAINGDVSYLLIRNTPRGSFLTVTQGNRELLRQPILQWR